MYIYTVVIVRKVNKLNRNIRMSKVALDLVNKVFGKLTVTGRVENHVSIGGRVSSKFNCVCECGNTKTITGDRLQRNRATSCGCSTYAPIHIREARRQARKETTSIKMKAVLDKAKLIKISAVIANLENDVLAGLCKPLQECDKYYLYANGKLFSLRSLKFLKVDFDHGDYKQTPAGLLRVRKVPMYTLVLDNDLNDLDGDRGELRMSIASMLLKTFSRQPTVGERAWRRDWLRNPKKRPELDELEWVSELEHAERSKVLSELVVLDGETRRRRIRKIEKQALLTLMKQQQVLKQWHDSERCYACPL